MRKIVIWLVLGIVAIFAILYLFIIPYKYSDEINAVSKEFSVDKNLIVTIINIESSFRKTAVSSAGAVGLMQILPSTAEEMCDRLDIEYSYDLLFKPEVNIRLGTYYLSYLLDYYEGNIINTISAYNWGLTNVNNWLSSGNIDKNGSVINIPIKETSDYIVKYKVYSKLYNIFYGF